jgi:hypothetical protein
MPATSFTFWGCGIPAINVVILATPAMIHVPFGFTTWAHTIRAECPGASAVRAECSVKVFYLSASTSDAQMKFCFIT